MTNEPKNARLAAKQPIVYVRAAEQDELPEELRSAPGTYYAVHDGSGKQLAIAEGRNLAFALARRNDLVPVSVH